MSITGQTSEIRIVDQEWYRAYYSEKGAERNSLLHNPEVLFQNLAQDAAMVRALQSVCPNSDKTRVLDVGCGEGFSLLTFLRLGFSPHNLYGIDFQEDRISRARQKFPGVNFECGDATKLRHPDELFDLVLESTMFIHSIDDDLSRKIASEMLRVTKSGGHILLCDWRYASPGSKAHKALSKSRMAELFHVGSEAIQCGTFRGPLIPPLGRFLSYRVPSLYFLVASMFPFLVGQIVTVLKKENNKIPEESGRKTE